MARVEIYRGALERAAGIHNNARARTLGDRIQRTAKRNLSRAGVNDTGKLNRSIRYTIKALPNGGTLLTVLAQRAGDNGADVAVIIHEGHKQFGPKEKAAIRFAPSHGRGVPGRGKRKGGFVFTTKVRAVGGVPYLTDAMVAEVIKEPGLKRFKVYSDPVRAPKPHTIRPGRGPFLG